MGVYDNLKDISKMYKHKNSNIAVLLGTGPSINEITNEQWDVINRYDKWTLNNWIYHPFIVPDFYHLELKHFNFFIFQRRMNEKRELYKNVKFFIANKRKRITLHFPNKTSKKNAGSLVDAIGPHPYVYKFEFRFLGRKNDKVINADYKMKKNKLTKKHMISITLMLELLYKFGYKKIYIYGVDLKDSRYFWTGWDKSIYGEVHHQSNKEHEGKDPNRPHDTYRIKDFIVDFNSRFMVPNNRDMFIGTKNTLLHPLLKYKDILES